MTPYAATPRLPFAHTKTGKEGRTTPKTTRRTQFPFESDHHTGPRQTTSGHARTTTNHASAPNNHASAHSNITTAHCPLPTRPCYRARRATGGTHTMAVDTRPASYL